MNVGEIAAKLADALSMFWLSLDDQERRLIVVGGLYLAAMVATRPLERRRRDRERVELVELVTARLEGRHA